MIKQQLDKSGKSNDNKSFVVITEEMKDVLSKNSPKKECKYLHTNLISFI